MPDCFVFIVSVYDTAMREIKRKDQSISELHGKILRYESSSAAQGGGQYDTAPSASRNSNNNKSSNRPLGSSSRHGYDASNSKYGPG